MVNYGAYGTLGGSGGGGGGPATSITIDVTIVNGGTPRAVLFVNDDTTVGDDPNDQFSYTEVDSYLQLGADNGVSDRGFLWMRGYVSSLAQLSGTILGAAYGGGFQSMLQSSNNGGKIPAYGLMTTRGGVGSEADTELGDSLGRLAWFTYWATGDRVASRGFIEGYADGGMLNTVNPQGIAFCTGQLILQNPPDRMIIDKTGSIGVNYPRLTTLYGLFGILSGGGPGTTPLFYIREETDTSFISQITIDKTFIHSGAVAFDAIQRDTTGGNSIVMDDYIRALYIDPATLISGLLIELPVNPYDAQEIIVGFGGTMTSGLVANSIVWGNVGYGVLFNTPVTSAVAGDSFMFKFDATISLWRVL